MVVALAAAGYSKDLGPGVYDVHSPQVGAGNISNRSEPRHCSRPGIQSMEMFRVSMPYSHVSPCSWVAVADLHTHHVTVAVQIPDVDWLVEKIQGFVDSGVLKGRCDNIWVNPGMQQSRVPTLQTRALQCGSH